MNTITLSQAIAILDTIATFDDSVNLHANYSGRFMYGAECVGYSVHNVSIVGMAIAQVLTGTDIDIAEVLRDCRTDDMGMQTIVYFPQLQVSDADGFDIVANVDDLEANIWKEALEVESKEEFEKDNDIKLAGEALAFFEAILDDGVITVSDASKFDDYVAWDTLFGTAGSPLELIPEDGIVDEALNNDLFRQFESWFQVSLQGRARKTLWDNLDELYSWVRFNYVEQV